MWQSEHDFVKDLAFLNDFGEPGDEEPYKFLHSLGRGSKMKEKSKVPKKFLDPRTVSFRPKNTADKGELIDIDDKIGIYNQFQESKGRGTLLGSYLRKKTQLQEQLRLARPMGSGDAAIESYCRRNITPVKPEIPAKISELEVPTETSADLKVDKTRRRVKATRNSSLQSNALISNLLSKGNTSSSAKETPDSYYSDSNTDFKIKEVNVFEIGIEVNKRTEKNNFTERSIDSYNQIENELESDCYIAVNVLEGMRQEEKANKMYKRLGESVKGSKATVLKNHYLYQCSNDTTSETDSDLEPIIFNNSNTNVFVYKKDDFPPLKRL